MRNRLELTESGSPLGGPIFQVWGWRTDWVEKLNVIHYVEDSLICPTMLEAFIPAT